jgi:quercetin dioxygenase-like cupin family protein
VLLARPSHSGEIRITRRKLHRAAQPSPALSREQQPLTRRTIMNSAIPTNSHEGGTPELLRRRTRPSHPSAASRAARALRFACFTGVFVAMALPVSSLAQAQTLYNITSTPIARGYFADERIAVKVQAHVGGKVETAQVHDAGDTVMAKITFGPKGFIGWHTHPGPAIVVVAQGTVTIYEGDDPACAGRDYTAGQSFVDLGQGHVHNAKNHSESDEAVVYVTYLDVPRPPATPLNLVEHQGDYCTLPD